MLKVLGVLCIAALELSSVQGETYLLGSNRFSKKTFRPALGSPAVRKRVPRYWSVSVDSAPQSPPAAISPRIYAETETHLAISLDIEQKEKQPFNLVARPPAYPSLCLEVKSLVGQPKEDMLELLKIEESNMVEKFYYDAQNKALVVHVNPNELLPFSGKHCNFLLITKQYFLKRGERLARSYNLFGYEENDGVVERGEGIELKVSHGLQESAGVMMCRRAAPTDETQRSMCDVFVRLMKIVTDPRALGVGLLNNLEDSLASPARSVRKPALGFIRDLPIPLKPKTFMIELPFLDELRCGETHLGLGASSRSGPSPAKGERDWLAGLQTLNMVVGTLKQRIALILLDEEKKGGEKYEAASALLAEIGETIQPAVLYGLEHPQRPKMIARGILFFLLRSSEKRRALVEEIVSASTFYALLGVAEITEVQDVGLKELSREIGSDNTLCDSFKATVLGKGAPPGRPSSKAGKPRTYKDAVTESEDSDISVGAVVAGVAVGITGMSVVSGLIYFLFIMV